MHTYEEAKQIRLVHSGSNYFELLEQLIRESIHTLHLQTYIFETDATGLRIIDALKAAAARGVSVYLMADAFGSFPFDKAVISGLKEAGVNFRLFSPLFSTESIFFGRRLHHKIAVADKSTGLIGGINIADKYNDTADTAWLDYAVLVKGHVCQYLHLLCMQQYGHKTAAGLKAWDRKADTAALKHGKQIRFRRNDWIRRRNEIHNSYTEAILNARRSVVIVASYFLPGSRFRKLLRQAAERGVNVKIILAGASDITSLRLAESYLYDFYLRHSIDIYEWGNSVMHGKAMLVDDAWVTIGSYNLNYLSHYISIELNADIADPQFAAQFSAHLQSVMARECRRVSSGPLNRRTRIFRLRIWLAYNFYRMIMGIMMLGKKHRKKLR